MKKIVFMGGKEVGYNCFLFLLNNSKKFDIEITALFSNSSKLNSEKFNCENLAREHDIEIYLNPEELLNLERPDFIISVQYHLILKEHIINRTKVLALNLHMAPVPEYRGCNQFSFAIIDNVKEFGTTIHKLDSRIDSGDVIIERRFEIDEACFAMDLNKRTTRESIELFKESIEKILKGDFTLTSQSELARSRKRGFYLRKDIERIKVIDDNWSNEKKKRFFRATYFPPYPPPVLKRGGDFIPLNMDWFNSLA